MSEIMFGQEWESYQDIEEMLSKYGAGGWYGMLSILRELGGDAWLDRREVVGKHHRLIRLPDGDYVEINFDGLELRVFMEQMLMWLGQHA